MALAQMLRGAVVLAGMTGWAIFAQDAAPAACLALAPASHPETCAPRVRGWLLLENKQYEAAETELTAALRLNPESRRLSFWIATAILRQKRVDKLPAYFFNLARAVHHRGPDGIPAAAYDQAAAQLKRSYDQVHYGMNGYDALVAAAQQSPFPPPPPNQKDCAKCPEPALGLWQEIRTALRGEGGEEYFKVGLEGALAPGGARNLSYFRGVVKSSSRTTVLLSVEGGDADARLQVRGVFPSKLAVGQTCQFAGVATAFAKDPYILTFTVWPSRLICH